MVLLTAVALITYFLIVSPNLSDADRAGNKTDSPALHSAADNSIRNVHLEPEPTEQRGGFPFGHEEQEKSNPMTAGYAVLDPYGQYQDHIEDAEAGDSGAMVEVAIAIQNCALIKFSSWEEFTHSAAYQSGQFPPAWEAQHSFVYNTYGKNCADLRTLKTEPSDSDFKWANRWFKAAAIQEDPIASIELALQRPIHESDLTQIASQLNQAYAAEDNRVGLYASRYFAQLDHPESDLLSTVWRLASCHENPACSIEVMTRNYRNQYLPADLAHLEDTAKKIARERIPYDFSAPSSVFNL